MNMDDKLDVHSAHQDGIAPFNLHTGEWARSEDGRLFGKLLSVTIPI